MRSRNLPLGLKTPRIFGLDSTMHTTVLVILFVALSVAACTKVSDYQRSCDQRTTTFSALVSCTESEVRSDFRSRGRDADFVDVYFNAGRVLSEQVAAGKITESEARYQWSVLFSQLKSAAKGRDDRAAQALMQTGAYLNSISQQPAYAPTTSPTHTYIIDGQMVTCTTTGVVTNCF